MKIITHKYIFYNNVGDETVKHFYLFQLNNINYNIE